MQTHISWTVTPVIGNVAIINAGIAAFFKGNGFAELDSLRLQTCLEGVFGYCVGNIKDNGLMEDITIDLSWVERDIIIAVRHHGPGGQWDSILSRETDKPIKRTSFESMGLFIARDLLHSLIYQGQYDIVSGHLVRTYNLVYRMNPDK